jgi:tRNA(Ile)-lysidine synthase
LDLIPYIEEKFNPGIKKILRQTSSLLQEEESLLDALTEDAYKHTVLEEDGSALDLVCLTGQHKAIQRRIIEKMLLKLDNNPSFRQIEQILYLAGHGENGAGVHLSRGLRGEIKGKKLLFSYPLGRTSWRGDLKSSVEDSVFDMDVMEPGLFCLDEARQVEVSCLDYLPEQSELASEGVDFFDLDLLSFPFKIRNRRPGDRFHPLGSPGHKKVGDFLTDLKVAESIRRHIPVLEYGGKVAALLGIRISHRFRVRSSTRKVMRVRVLGACRT